MRLQEMVITELTDICRVLCIGYLGGLEEYTV